MAYPFFNCSISKQDCKSHNGIFSFTSSSCVPYQPWLTGDIGICGWVGAPCTAVGPPTCNSDAVQLCVNGHCGFGLGDTCPSPNDTNVLCNGSINCGLDGKCGGRDAYLSEFPPDDGFVNHVPVRELCISGVGSNTTSSYSGFRCTDPAAQVSPSSSASTSTVSPNSPTPSSSTPPTPAVTPPIGPIVGGTIGGLVFVLVLVILYLYWRRAQSTRLLQQGVGQQDTDDKQPPRSTVVSQRETVTRESRPMLRDLGVHPASPASQQPVVLRNPGSPTAPFIAPRPQAPTPTSPSIITHANTNLEPDLHAEVAALRVQVELLQASAASQPAASDSGDAPPPYEVQ